MFAVMEIERISPRPFFRRRTKKVFTLEKTEDFFKVSVKWPVNTGENELERCADLTMRALAALNVTGIVLPRDFPFPFLAQKYKIAVSTPVPLYRRLAGRMVLKALEGLRREDVKIGIYGKRVTPELENCVMMLKNTTRKLMISAGRETEAFCFALRQKLGIAAQSAISPAADIIVLFSCPNETLNVSENAVIINVSGGGPSLKSPCVVYAGAEMRVAARWQDKLPSGSDTPGMLAALAGAGVIQVADIIIESLTV